MEPEAEPVLTEEAAPAAREVLLDAAAVDPVAVAPVALPVMAPGPWGPVAV